MTDPWGTPDPNAQPAVPSYGQPGPSLDKGAPSAPPPGYGAPPTGNSTPPPGYGAPPTAYGTPPATVPSWSEPTGDGPIGQIRRTGISILLFAVTFGIYSYVYNYKVHKEMQQHSHRGLGGGIALLLTFVAGIAMPFVTPAEVGSLSTRRGEKAPVTGWTGLWVVLPALAGYGGLIVAAISAAVTSTPSAEGTRQISSGAGAGIAVGVLFAVVVAVAGAVTWFIKTNGALNRYWRSVGAQG